ncbi:hypothetical protein AVME950_00280 [Acidovorax sp. SUPP950]|uniref:hypothetical protein n=1 Tax=Acidovorax sp. SUPP950 TaxID=511901 RepID=UPI0023C28F59|nr:hypothetical protein [Acidovorax sp. SUPP950]GKS73274.1 hypothetical protein AVME950_00280 [Acidovorax sp. SUPP950]
MWILLPAIFMTCLLTAFIGARGDAGAAEIRTRANDELMHYKTFIAAADMYFRSHPAPAASTRYTWTMLKASAPAAMSAATMRDDWYAVRDVDGSWAACTQLREEAARKVTSLFPGTGGPRAPSPTALLALGDQAAAATATSLCERGAP